MGLADAFIQSELSAGHRRHFNMKTQRAGGQMFYIVSEATSRSLNNNFYCKYVVIRMSENLAETTIC